MTKDSRILLVDDDPYVLTGLGESLEQEGYRVTTAQSGQQALRALKQESFDLVLTDLVIDDVDGIEILKNVKDLRAETKVIILTGYGDMDTAIQAIRHKADDYVLKTASSGEIKFKVAGALEKLALEHKTMMYEAVLPVCCVCKKIRDDRGEQPGNGTWTTIEGYFSAGQAMAVTSTYCPDCCQKAEQELDSYPGGQKSL